MNMDELLSMVEEALYGPNADLLEFCDPWYSPYYQLMYLLADYFDETSFEQPIAVELGVDQGRGSKALLMGCARVYAVENNVEKKCERIAHIQAFTLIHASSTPVPPEIEALGKSISILLIDTEHSFAQARSEFEAYRPFLKNGAIVLFDDTNAMEGEVRRYVETLPYEKFFDDRLHESCGFGGLIYREGV